MRFPPQPPRQTRRAIVWAHCSLALAMVGVVSASGAEEDYTNDERAHWAFVPRANVQVPSIPDADRDWLRTPVDAFVLSKLREHGLQPAGEASRETLLRRLSFDLRGLPPSPEEIERFTLDPAPDAYEQLVERMLASPQYGERMAQHWLDLVRFAESEGFEYDRHRPQAWRYRDYVIRAFQQDRPYDRFLREQIAGDELAPDDEDARTAVGFLRLGPIRRNAGAADVAFSRNEVLTEMTDTLGVAFLGLTLGCARCHDHRFDAIRQSDYYRMQAFLVPIEDVDVPLADAAAQAAWKAQTDKLQALIKPLDSELDEAPAARRPVLLARLAELERQLPPPLPELFSVRNASGGLAAVHLLKRGLEDRPEGQVTPRVLGVLLQPGAAPLPANVANPRSRLADWIVDPANPLTARVFVNRVWLAFFGQGIVATPNDFGVNGAPPSHPELLDYLANQFIASGWSVKALQRLILLSSTYRMSSAGPIAADQARIDPGNRLLSRFPRRRLSAEELRDSLLANAGRLNLKAGGPSVMVPVESELVDLLYKPSQWQVANDPAEHSRRSIYLISKRNLRLPFLEVFDQPAQQVSCPRRESSTHAPQTLELLNGEFSNQLARDLAARLEREASASRERQVALGFLLATGRPVTPDELRLSLEFLETQPLAEFCLALFNLNDFLYVQ